VTWEYQILTLSIEKDKSQVRTLNQMGAKGWELISVLPNSFDDLLRDMTYVFKRPRTESSEVTRIGKAS
jgi:hypothetical protein